MPIADDVLYDNDTNVLKTGRSFKAYVESAFGRNSPEWNLIKGLKFEDFRRN